MATPAQVAAAAGDDSYNYYPQTMIDFCAISYDDISSIPAAVQQLGWTVVWGPAQLLSDEGVSYSLAFVASRNDPNETTVVIRGTNLDSWTAWTSEDFDIGTTVPFTQLVPTAPAGAVISQGTLDGINDLLQLTDPATNASLVSYLQGVTGDLYVTGHSLGGTLVAPMTAYLNYVLYGGGYFTNMAMWSFAGLTPGNADFNNYFTSLGNPEFPWRLYNTLDIAPDCWGNLPAIKTIYTPPLTYGLPESLVLDGLFLLADGKGYAQPTDGSVPLAGTFQQETGDFAWIDEAIYQHHFTTYQTLVDQAYPLSNTAAQRPQRRATA